MRGLLRRNMNDSGFTLLEILVVLILLAALFAVVGMNVIHQMERGKRSTAKIQIGSFRAQLREYKLDNNTYPETEQGLDALYKKPASSTDLENWSGPYSDGEIPKDPWDHPYVYRYPGVHNPDGYDLSSLGSDGKEGGEGDAADITNWK